MKHRDLGGRLGAAAALVVGLGAGPALAAGTDAAARLADLAARIEAQERLLAKAQADLAAQKAELSALLQGQGGPVAGASEVETLPEARDEPAVQVAAAPEPAIRISGSLRTDFRASSARSVGSSASGFYLAPPDSTGREAIYDATAQYSNIALAADGPEVFGFRTGARVVLSFFEGGALNSSYGVQPAAAFVWMAKDGWTLSMGRRQEVFADREPEMVDTTSVLNFSGNAANSPRTQFRVEHAGPVRRDGQAHPGPGPDRSRLDLCLGHLRRPDRGQWRPLPRGRGEAGPGSGRRAAGLARLRRRGLRRLWDLPQVLQPDRTVRGRDQDPLGAGPGRVRPPGPGRRAAGRDLFRPGPGRVQRRGRRHRQCDDPGRDLRRGRLAAGGLPGPAGPEVQPRLWPRRGAPERAHPRIPGPQRDGLRQPLLEPRPAVAPRRGDHMEANRLPAPGRRPADQ